MNTLTLKLLPDKFGICKLDTQATVPLWALKASFFSITRTNDELSIVVTEQVIPADVQAEKGWRALKVEGVLDFSLTGILYSIAKPLAEAQISIFAISTFNTDYILIKEQNLERAKKALSQFVVD